MHCIARELYVSVCMDVWMDSRRGSIDDFLRFCLCYVPDSNVHWDETGELCAQLVFCNIRYVAPTNTTINMISSMRCACAHCRLHKVKIYILDPTIKVTEKIFV